MLSFKKFITESALERKVMDGFQENPLPIEGAEVVHHDPSQQLTVYHLKHRKGLQTFGTQTNWCTAPHGSQWSGKYLRSGNVFGVVKGPHRFQMFVPKKTGTGERRDPEFRVVDNSPIAPKGQEAVLGKSLITKIKKKPHAVPDVDWGKLSDKDAVSELKSMPSMERLNHYRAIAGSGGVAVVGKSLEGIEKKFTKHDLGKFSDDPDHHDFIASYAPIDDVAHMKNHPDGNTRRIIQQRLSGFGGKTINPHPQSTYQPHKDQMSLNLPKPKKKAAQGSLL